jgi:REase_DpnII-MboI
MTSPATQSIARQLAELETELRTEAHWAQESPEAGFARHVYDSVREEGPVSDWPAAPSPDALRRGMAPDLAAFGYRIAGHRCEPDDASRSAWEAGLNRLSQREAFTADRQTFVFRPVEMFGLALGFHASPGLPDVLRSWFRVTIERLGRDYPHDDWGGPLYQTAARLTGAAWNPGRSQQAPVPTIEGFALLKWLGLAYPEQPATAPHMDVDREILRRALLEQLKPTDLARTAILYQAIRRASIERLESDLAATWQTNRLTRDGVAIVTNLCRRFQQFALQLQYRHDSRPTVTFNDEYDVQDALHAILRLHFEDVRAEEWTPSYAGNAARMDFLLKREHIVVEAKMTRKSLKQKDVANQLIQDKERYRAHPECQELICFVYDPGHFLANPTALEDDLSTVEPNLTTCVIVSPKI